MAESMNLDSTDLVGSLEEFETLETIQAELDRLNQERDQEVSEKNVMETNSLDMIEVKEEFLIKEDKIKMETDMSPPDEERRMREVIIEETVSGNLGEDVGMSVNQIIHSVIDVSSRAESYEILEGSESDGQCDDIPHNDHTLLPSDVNIDSNDMQHESNTQDTQDDLDDLHSDKHVLFNSDNEMHDEMMSDHNIKVESMNVDSVYDHVGSDSQHMLEGDSNSDPFASFSEIASSSDVKEGSGPEISLPSSNSQHEEPTSCTVSELSVESNAFTSEPSVSKVPTTGVFVMTSSGNLSTPSVIHADSLMTAKDPKVRRVVVPGSIDGTPSAGQTIRIVAPPGKLLGNCAKTITLAQARQMGLFTQAKINNILPAGSVKVATPGVSKVVLPASSNVGAAKKTVTVMKSPAKILPAPAPTTHSVVTPICAPKGQKLLIRQANALKPGTIIQPGSQVIRIPGNAANLQQYQLAGKQVQFVKLVGPAGSNKSQITLLPVTALPKGTTIPMASATSQQSFKVLPISSAPRPSPVPGSSGARVLIPASAVTPATSTASATHPSTAISNIMVLPSHLLQPVKKDPAANVTTTLQSSSPNGEQPSSPPSINNMKDPPSPSSSHNSESLTPPLGAGGALSNASIISNSKMEGKIKEESSWSFGGPNDEPGVLEANGIRPRKPCNCTKSMCLKLYCDCFANGEFCYQCNCTCCFNNLAHEEERQKAIKLCLERNPTAFKPKIGKSFVGSDERRHNRGCNCRRSGCLKNYCECYEAKIPCSKNCKCFGCKNTESFSNRRIFVHSLDDDKHFLLSSKHKFPDMSHKSDASNGARQAFNLMTMDIIQATCKCLVAQAEMWEKDTKQPVANAAAKDVDVAHSLIIEEFGRCVVQIIDCLTKSISQVPTSS